MSKTPHASTPLPDIDKLRYVRLAATPWHSLLLVAPALLVFQIGLIFTDPSKIPLAPEHLGKILEFFGTAVPHFAPVAVAIVLLGQHVAHKDAWKVYPDVLGCMGIEAILWMLPLIALSELTGLLASQDPSTAPRTFDMLMIAIGAGVYEEFIFRLAGLGLIGLILVDLMNIPRKVAVGVAIAITAIAFSLYHPQTFRDGFQWIQFVFRALAGGYLAMVYLLRGFGIVTWSHILFNVYVVLIQSHVWQ